MESIRIYGEQVTRNFGNISALNNISFDVKGERIAILGHNGSGKTTLMSMILGLLNPSSGKVSINGVESYRHHKWVSENLSFCFEKGKMPYSMTVKSFLNTIKDVWGREDVINNICQSFFVNRFEQLQMNRLSTGQEQILYILTAVLSSAPILFLDEPFTHLDTFVSSSIYDYLLSSGKNLVITTQSIEEAETLADSFLVIGRGKLIWQGNKDELYDDETFEVMPIGNTLDTFNLDVLYTIERRIICKSTEENLSKLLMDHKIMGFRRAGLRKIYGKTGQNH